MARRSDHSREELEELFLASARRFAESEGLSGIAARRVARDVDYTAGTTNNVFGNLDGLIMRLRADTLDELYAYSAEIPLGPEPAENLRTLVSALAMHDPEADEHSPEANTRKGIRLLAKQSVMPEASQIAWRADFP